MRSYKVTFAPAGLEVTVTEGCTIMETIHEAGLDFDFPCGGNGLCGKCRIKILAGVGLPTGSEQELLDSGELEEGIRLACLTEVHDDIWVEFPSHSRLEHHILMASSERTFSVEPHLKKIFIEPAGPSVHDQRSDWGRLLDSLRQQGCHLQEQDAPLSLLRQLPENLEAAKHRVTAVLNDRQILGLERQDTTAIMLGMAFDIGTTTIVGYLLDLYSGQELSVVSTLNPQTRFGADVISRITIAGKEADGLLKLHAAVTEAINNLIREAASKAGVDRKHIYSVTIAANTCMHHLFLGINPKSIALSPYVAAVSEPVVADAADLHLDINPVGKIFVLPNIAGFVGADTTAVLLATELDRSEDIKLVIDIGTNGELVLGCQDKLVACSAAAGPAFEGAQIKSGMRGAAGAIDHVYFRDKLEYSVIGGGSPLGICGSALLDTVAGLVELGMIDKRGKFLPPEKLANPAALRFRDNLIKYDGDAAFLLTDALTTGHGRPIMVTQGDIRELQLAKGAMAAGVRVLIESCGIQVEDIKEVLLAGAFGNYLNPHSACVIGLIPPELEGKIKMIGNAAGTGAKLALLSAGEYRRAARITGLVKFVELGSYPGFNSIFGESTYFRTLVMERNISMEEGE